MKSFFLLAVVSVAALDCSNENYLTTTPNTAGTRVIYDGRLFTAQWSVNNIPGSDIGWADLGACENAPPVPDCWPAYDSSAIYPNANSQVSVGGANYVNQWYADPNAGPATSQGAGNWLRVHPCGGSGGFVPPAPVTSTTTAAPSTTTTVPMTTTKPNVPVPITTTKPNVPVPTTTTTPNVPVPTTTTQAATTTKVATTASTTKATTTAASPGGGNQQRPTGPTGASGECVWPAWDSGKIYGGEFIYYVTHKGGVYQKSYYCDAGREPGVDPCWAPKVASCTGEPPVVKLTVAELAAMVDPNGPKYQMFVDPWDPTSPTAAELAAVHAKTLSSFTADQRRVIAALQVLDTDVIEAIAPGLASNPDNVKRVERVVTKSTFDQVFPVRHPKYTYENLLKGVGAFPAYCQTYADGRDSDKICLNLLITSFAHNVQEVGGHIPSLRYKDGNHLMDGGIHHHPESDAYFTEGQPIPLWQQALWFLREIGYVEDGGAMSGYRKCAPESQDSAMWAFNYQCPEGRDYFGRGSKQLSYNYNYGMFSKLFFGDASYLLTNPGLVADSWLNFASGIWFAVTPQSPKPSMLEVLDGSWVPNSVDASLGIQAGFGATINIINGGEECDKAEISERVQNRIDAYKNFAAFFGYTIPASEQLDCTKQKAFQKGGAGDMSTYWANSWNTPFTCELIGYQSAFLAAIPGDYEACVNYWFKSRWVDRDTKKIVGQYGNIGDNASPPV